MRYPVYVFVALLVVFYSVNVQAGEKVRLTAHDGGTAVVTRGCTTASLTAKEGQTAVMDVDFAEKSSSAMGSGVASSSLRTTNCDTRNANPVPTTRPEIAEPDMVFDKMKKPVMTRSPQPEPTQVSALPPQVQDVPVAPPPPRVVEQVPQPDRNDDYGCGLNTVGTCKDR